MSDDSIDQIPEKEAERIRDEALKRALTMPPVHKVKDDKKSGDGRRQVKQKSR